MTQPADIARRHQTFPASGVRMIVYSRSETAWRVPFHILNVAPAADIQGEAPSEWLKPDGAPKTMPVEFRFGRAEVSSNLGDYLLAHGYAQRTALILPAAAALAA